MVLNLTSLIHHQRIQAYVLMPFATLLSGTSLFSSSSKDQCFLPPIMVFSPSSWGLFLFSSVAALVHFLLQDLVGAGALCIRNIPVAIAGLLPRCWLILLVDEILALFRSAMVFDWWRILVPTGFLGFVCHSLLCLVCCFMARVLVMNACVIVCLLLGNATHLSIFVPSDMFEDSSLACTYTGVNGLRELGLASLTLDCGFLRSPPRQMFMPLFLIVLIFL